MFVVLASKGSKITKCDTLEQVRGIESSSENIFELPADKEKLIRRLEGSIRYLELPMNEDNWKLLLLVLGSNFEESAKRLLDNLRWDAGTIYSFAKKFKEMLLNNLAIYVNDKKPKASASTRGEQAIAYLKKKTEEIKISLEEKSKSKHPTKLLTDVNPDPTLFAQMMVNLGDARRIQDIENGQRTGEQRAKFIIVDKILNLLIEWLGKYDGRTKLSLGDIKRMLTGEGIKLITTKTEEVEVKRKIKTVTVEIAPSEAVKNELKKLRSIIQVAKDIDYSPDDDEATDKPKSGGRPKPSDPDALLTHIDALLAVIFVFKKGKIDSSQFTSLEKHLSPLAKWIEKVLPTQDTIRVMTSFKKTYGLEIEVKSTRPKLEEWQQKTIDSVKDGLSLLVVGPTSGGKTFTSLVAIDMLRKGDSILAYVAPTFHLALQTYATICKTFRDVNVSLVTGIVNNTVKDTRIWVGTPDSLYSYFSATGETFDIGIFDEIHTLSEEYGGGGYEARILSHALSSLISKCKKQLIALSATVNSEDILNLQNELVNRTRGSQVKFRDTPEIYTKRKIELKKYIYQGDKIAELASVGASDLVPEEVTPEKTYALIRTLAARTVADDSLSTRLPVLMFTQTDEECYRQFTEFVDWIEDKIAEEYKDWNMIRDKWTDKITSYNNTCDELVEHPEKIDELKALRDAMCSSISEELNAIASKHEPGSLTAKDYTTEAASFRKDIRDGSGTLRIPCNKPPPQYAIGPWHSEFNTFEDMQRLPNSPDGKRLTAMCTAEGITVKEVKDILSLINRGLKYGISIVLPTMPFIIQYTMMHLLTLEKITMLFCSKSFSMGINMPVKTVIINSQPVSRTSSRVPDLYSFKNPEGELPSPDEVGIEGLSEFEPERELPLPEEVGIEGLSEFESPGEVTFAPMNICEIMQMEGRAGRWGKGTIRPADPYGHVVYWNVSVAHDVKIENLPRMIFPPIVLRGSRIENPQATAIDIGLSIVDENDLNALTTCVRSLKPRHIEAMIEDDDDDAYHRVFSKASVVSVGTLTSDQIKNALGITINPIGKAIEFSSEKIEIIVGKLQRLISTGSVIAEDKINVYHYAEQICLLKRGIQELHTRYHKSTADNLLAYLKRIFEILHLLIYKQLQLKKI